MTRGESVPPKAAITRLRDAGIKRALVSSSSDEGTQKLYAEAPDFIIPRSCGLIGRLVKHPRGFATSQWSDTSKSG